MIGTRKTGVGFFRLVSAVKTWVTQLRAFAIKLSHILEGSPGEIVRSPYRQLLDNLFLSALFYVLRGPLKTAKMTSLFRDFKRKTLSLSLFCSLSFDQLVALLIYVFGLNK